jgi:hypothetical protein
MSSEAEQYYSYARECVEMAEQAGSEEARKKILELARVWTTAALLAEQPATKAKPPSPHVA